MATEKINDIKPSENETKNEKMLIGFLRQEAGRIQYGKVMVEFTIRNGRVDRAQSTEINRTFNVGGRDT
jgi:hypothetical protein